MIVLYVIIQTKLFGYIWSYWVHTFIRTQNSELRILFDIIHVQLIETNSVGSLLL